MSFQSRDLMIDLSPVVRPGFEMCGQATRDQQEGDGDNECGQATRDSEPTKITGMNLAALRQQLRQALSSETRL
ncbi:MAG TPA: hypothetical protein VLE27_09440 [Thermoanaerobaculia bacterium]|nr:hypothetical protein [Thermoanaerobaculia bacterium]